MGYVQAIAALVIAAASAFGGFYIEKTRWDESIASQQVAAVKIATTQSVASGDVEKSYVQSLGTIVTPAATIADEIKAGCAPAKPVAAPAIAAPHRVRHAGASGVSVPAGHGPQPADVATAADTHGDVLGNLAVDVPACEANRQQLIGLQALVKANSPAGR